MGNSEEYNKITKYSYDSMISVGMPIMTGTILCAKEIVLFLAGDNFDKSIPCLLILSGAFLFCLCGSYWGDCILVPNGGESIILWVTILSAVINIALNIILIPLWGENVAAITTLISQFIGFVILHKYGKKYVENRSKEVVVKVLIGCIGIIAVCYTVDHILTSNNTFILIMKVIVSVIVYAIVEIKLKNPVAVSYNKSFLTRLYKGSQKYK